MKNLWDLIKIRYKIKFNIPTKVIDYIAVRPILIKSLSGYSNRRIAFSIRDEESYVREVLKEFIDFPGWKYDLDFNPIALYNQCKGNINWFRDTVLNTSAIRNMRLIDKSFYLVRNFYSYIESEIKKYYESG